MILQPGIRLFTRSEGAEWEWVPPSGHVRQIVLEGMQPSVRGDEMECIGSDLEEFLVFG
jgi:hypothetical protein